MITDYLLSAMKGALKEKGLSYKQAGEALGLSESSVKRLFSVKNFTLLRLETLCELAETDLPDLMQRAENLMKKTDQLSIDQEQEIVNNPRLLLVGVCVLNHCLFEEILEKYNFTKTELIHLFALLDKLGIVEFLPGNKYRLTISKRFSWRPNGPILQLFTESIAKDLLFEKIYQPTNHLNYIWGMLTKESAKKFENRIQRLLDEYLQFASNDVGIPMKEKMTSSLLILFREDWEPEIFRTQHRRPG